MRRSTPLSVAVLAVSSLVSLVPARAQETSLETALSGKEVTLRIDMPGSQKGVDLRFNKPTPMNWKEYSGRLKEFGIAIHKGDTARITAVVVKGDLIELQLNGGGFGTFGDNTSTVVTTKPVEKSDYEKQLEKQIADTDDEDRKRSLQRDLDRERSRRERQDAANRSNDQVASQIRSLKVADDRAHGGSRFNLRWSGSIPPDQKTPDALAHLLTDYVDFGAAPSSPPSGNIGAAPASPPSGDPATPATAQLRRGMPRGDVSNLLGPGRSVSQSVSDDGLHTEVVDYLSGDRHIEVTFVENLVVRFTISSQ